MNVGIVGGGNISDTHARAAHAAGLRVAAVFGDNRAKARQLAERHGATAFDTLDAFLQQPSLDLVMIGSPSGCHAEHATAAVRARRHILVEKPLEISVERIDALLGEVARAGVVLGVFFQDRLKPDVVAMKRRIEAGDIGTPLVATGEVKWFRTPAYYADSRWRGSWSLAVARWQRWTPPPPHFPANRAGSRSWAARDPSFSKAITSGNWRAGGTLARSSLRPASLQRAPHRLLSLTLPLISGSSRISSMPSATAVRRCATVAKVGAASKSSRQFTGLRVRKG